MIRRPLIGAWLALVSGCGQRELTWGEPTSLGSGSDPQVALTADGLAVAVWLDGSTLRAAHQEPGLDWVGDGALSTFEGTLLNYEVVAAQDDTAIAAWSIYTYTSMDIRVSRFERGAWESPVRIVSTPLFRGIDVALGGDGRATVVFEDGSPTDLMAIRQMPEEAWSAPVALGMTGPSDPVFQVAAGASGVVVVWSTPAIGGSPGLWAAFAPTDGDFREPEHLTATDPVLEGLVASGDAFVAQWWEASTLHYSQLDASGWGETQTLAAGVGYNHSALAGTDDGAFIAAISGDNGVYAVRGAPGVSPALERMSAAGSWGSVAANSAGEALLSWAEDTDDGVVLEVSHSAPDAPWDEPLRLDETGWGVTSVDLDEEGRGVVMWTRGEEVFALGYGR